MRRQVTVGLGALVVLAGSALGQEAPAPPEKQPPLKGPAVRENRAPHVEDQFAEGMRPQGRMGPQIPMRAYAEVIGKLRGESAPDGLRLSEDQEQKLGAIEQEFREASKAYNQQRREQRTDEPMRPKPDENAPDQGNQRRRREAAQDMMRNGPKPGDYQTRIWAVLNEKQQAFAKVELDKVKDEMQKRRGEESMQRRLAQQGGKPEGGPPGRPQGGETDARPLRERAMRLVRRMAQLPEEDRERMLSRIEAELDRRGIPDVPPPSPEGDRPAPKPPER